MSELLTFSEAESEWLKAARYGNLLRLRKLSTESWTAERFRMLSGRALILATEEDRNSTVKWLLRHPSGVELNAGYPYQTALMIASIAGNVEIVKELLDHGADITTTNDIGINVLHYAAIEGRQEIIQMLIDHGADVTTANKFGSTALHFASAFTYDQEIIQLLVDSGADVNARKSDGTTALGHACKLGSTKMAKILLGLGANGASKDKGGKTPLAWAFSSTRGWEVFKLLIDHGADVDAVLSCPLGYETPLGYSCQLEDTMYFFELIACGADIRKKNSMGQTPLEVAKQYGNENHPVVECLTNLLRPLEPSILSPGVKLHTLYRNRLLQWLGILEKGLTADCAWKILGYMGSCCDLGCDMNMNIHDNDNSSAAPAASGDPLTIIDDNNWFRRGTKRKFHSKCTIM